MGVGACVAMIAIGAILKFATYIDLSGLGIEGNGFAFGGISVDTVGVILMVTGGLGLLVVLMAARGRTREYR